LVINPVVHSFLEFLPLSRLEFSQKIRNEIESNPWLETEVGEFEAPSKTENEYNEIEERLQNADESYLNNYEDERFLKHNDDRLDKNRIIELFAASQVSLTDHLMEQARSEFTERELDLAKHIIYNLNRDGYLDVEVTTIADSLSSSAEEIDAIRRRIMSFDPRGVAAQNLEECLLAQLNEDEALEHLTLLIMCHLDDLARLKYQDIQKSMSIDADRLNALIAKIRRLSPKPASRFDVGSIDYAEIDLLLVKEENNYVVHYIDEGMPRLVLSSHYDAMMADKSDRDTRSYLKDKYRNAKLFIEGIDLRKQMVVKIAQLLVDKQKDYLDFGEKWKKPLIMREVAEELSLSESTVSRAVSNKYMATDMGIILLKSFFAHGIKGDYGFTHSVSTIVDKIKRIIDEEPRSKPMSDQQIAEQLTNLGIHISRRTIRNYRDELNIPSSSKRKEQYLLSGMK
jgi:RNA polymerase sigma-54 factor